MGYLTESQRGMIVGAHLVGASAATVANIVGVSKGNVSNVIRAHLMHGKRRLQSKTVVERQFPGHRSKCEEAYPVVQGSQRVYSKAVETRDVVR
ncbi:hypothetical protein C0J52_11571 [Blattella germanica]|nr:hypothetical protein C0J52_11571 [Blattella germanica]